VHVAVVDVSAFLWRVGIAAAGEFGHAILKRGTRLCAIVLSPPVGFITRAVYRRGDEA
jgi:hypothetical protein